MPRLLEALARRRWDGHGVLLHYSDPFLMRSAPLRDVEAWPGPTLLACGDLHHGPAPIETLEGYLRKEPHDAVLLTFNPSSVEDVQQRLKVPVRCLAPTFFRYPTATPTPLQMPTLSPSPHDRTAELRLLPIGMGSAKGLEGLKRGLPSAWSEAGKHE